MFRSKTLFVLGAGSSNEVGLPIGEGLKKAIAEKIDIRFEYGYKQISGDHQIMHAIREHAKARGGALANPDPNPYLEKAWQLRNALPQAISIDNLLDAHKGDDLAEACGKFGIVKCILEAEHSSKLYCSEPMQKINFSEVGDTWFSGFMKILTEGVAKSQVNEIFDNVSFINFNYDRCVVHYLFDALQVYYGLDASSVRTLMKALKVLHPYGSVGQLPWQIQNVSAVPYGMRNGNILEISRGIKTFNEQIDDGEDLQALRSLVQEAEIIVFLGFAFHRQNIELLRPGESCRAKRVYATAINISSSDCEIIKGEIEELLSQDGSKAKIEINNHKTCNELFKEYWRGLTAGA